MIGMLLPVVLWLAERLWAGANAIAGWRYEFWPLLLGGGCADDLRGSPWDDPGGSLEPPNLNDAGISEKRRDERWPLLLSVFFRENPNDVRREDSVDWRGVGSSLGIGCFMLVGG